MEQIYFIVFGTRGKIESIHNIGAFTKIKDAQDELNKMGYEGTGYAKYINQNGEFAFIHSLNILSN